MGLPEESQGDLGTRAPRGVEGAVLLPGGVEQVAVAVDREQVAGVGTGPEQELHRIVVEDGLVVVTHRGRVSRHRGWLVGLGPRLRRQ